MEPVLFGLHAALYLHLYVLCMSESMRWTWGVGGGSSLVVTHVMCYLIRLDVGHSALLCEVSFGGNSCCDFSCLNVEQTVITRSSER